MVKFVVGHTYTVGPYGKDRWECISLDDKVGWFKTPCEGAYIHTTFGQYSELVEYKSEEWVSVYWTDGFKTNVEVGSKIYESETECSQRHANNQLFHSVLRLR